MKEFYIMSYWAAAFLLTMGIPPKRIELSPRGKRLFFYVDNTTVRNHIQEFYENADLQKYVRSCIELKSEMYKIKQQSILC